MISIQDLTSCCQAVEFLHYGVDITKLDTLKGYYNPVEKKIQTRISPKIENIIIKLSQDVIDFLEWPIGNLFIREGSQWSAMFVEGMSEDDKKVKAIEIDLDSFKQVMTILKDKGFCDFFDIPRSDYDKDYEKKITEMRKNWNYHDTSFAKDMIENLSIDKTRINLTAMLSCSMFPDKVGEAILKAFNNPADDFEIEALKDYEIIDNRMYIRLSELDIDDFLKATGSIPNNYTKDLKYIVISRNPYDYYFCSYGSNIQSCFSINGTNFGWYGITGLSSCKGNFLVYGTSGRCNKINIINGQKWNVPRMIFRFWGWLGEDNKLYIDRCYPSGDWAIDRNKICKILTQFLKYDVYNTCCNRQQIPLKYGKEMHEFQRTYRLHWYPDSVDENVREYHGVCYGKRDFIGNCPLRRSLLSIMQQIQSVSPAFTYTNDYNILNGVLTKIKLCPITNVPILEEETVSPYAKFFKEPIKALAVATFCDGYFKGDVASRIPQSGSSVKMIFDDDSASNIDSSSAYFTRHFSYKTVNIKVFKETITGLAKKSCYNCILVRYVEGDKVTYVKYQGLKDDK